MNDNPTAGGAAARHAAWMARALQTVHIPKLIHVIWIGPNPFPYHEYLESWRSHNPGWRVRLWTDDNIPALHNQAIYDFLGDTPHAVRADLLRLELLYQFGGLYSDADSQCWRPLRPLVAGKTLFGMANNCGNVANGTLGATRGHPAMRALVEGIGYRYHTMRADPRNAEGHSIFALFGTRYISKLLRSYPDFTQIDEGCVKGSRKLIASSADANVKTTFIAHDCAVSWKRGSGSDRVVL